MAKIIWLASYPRSGNTWLRFLIADLVYGPVKGSMKVMRRIPDVEWGVRAQHLHGGGSTIVKTHWKWHRKMPLREDAIGALYLVRNPLDVMVSALNHARLNGHGFRADMGEAELQEASRAWIDEYIALGGTRNWMKLGFGTWEENVGSWLSRLPFPCLVVKYEELHGDTAGVLARISKFFVREANPERIAGAIERCSFTAMRAIEDREIAERRPGVFFLPNRQAAHESGLRFVNRGQVGSAAYTLTPEQRQAATDRFRSAMERLGYA